jgi:hypothetical protein
MDFCAADGSASSSTVGYGANLAGGVYLKD